MARWLTSQGHVGEHVADVLPVTSRDRDIAVLVARLGAIVVTKDADFLDIQVEGAPKILLVTTGNITNAALLEQFVECFPAVASALEQGASVVTLP